MIFFDIKCFIVVSVFENVLVSEGLYKGREVVYTPYRSFYLRKDRRNNDFDYNFKDWESTTPDTLYDLSNTPLNVTKNYISNQTLSKEENITYFVQTIPTVKNITYSVQTIPTAESLTIVEQKTGQMTTKQELTANTESTFGNLTLETTIPTIQEINTNIQLNSSSLEYQKSSLTYVEETEGVHVTLPPEATVSDLLQWLASTSPTEYTTDISPPPTINVEDLMPGPTQDPDQTPALVISTKNPIYEEIKDEIKKKHGYFTASLHELLKILSHKKASDVKNLLSALNTKIDSYIHNEALVMFGTLMVETFQSAIQMMILAPDDIREEYIHYAMYAVENRHTAMKRDVNIVFDVIDNIYSDHDLTRIGFVLRRIDELKNDTDLSTLATDTITAFVFDPYQTITGTAKERLLKIEIENILDSRLHPGQQMGRRFGKIKEFGKVTRQCKSVEQIKNNRQRSKKQSKEKITGFHKIKYKSPIKEVQNKLYRKNTEDKYDVNKIATTLKYFYAYEGTKNISFENSLQSQSATSSESSCDQKGSSKYNIASRYNYGNKTVNKKYSLKSYRRYLKSHKALNKNKAKFEIHDKSTKYKSSTYVLKAAKSSQVFEEAYSLQINDENILKLNLMDALIHSGKNIKRRQNQKKINKVRYVESFSDDEAILKSNLYKAFGLSKDFQEQLRTLHMLKMTSAALKL